MSSNQEDYFEALLEYIRNSRGFDFTGYKRSSLRRRITKRMQSLQIENYEDYLDYLQVDSNEFPALFNTVLINVTDFFRNRPAWDYLQTMILPGLLSTKSTEPIRVWSAGCASGEEAYTIAIILAEQLGREKFRQQVKIYATDVDEEALNESRYGLYPAESIEAVPAELRERYFDSVGTKWVIRSDLRRAVIFGRHDLVQDPPISRLDLLVCRNTLMYFNAETQRRILHRFYFGLRDTGILFLGKAEMLMIHANLFVPVDLKHRIFQKVATGKDREQILALSPHNNQESRRRRELYLRLRELAGDSIPVAQIVVDKHSNLVFANALALSTFNLSAEDTGRPLRDLEISYRPLELRSRIATAYQECREICETNVSRNLSDSTKQYFDIKITPLQENDQEVLGASIIFTDVTRYHELESKLQESNQELETTNQELQSSNQELETTNEELQSTNEELETTNEELQSTNEELETTNEELQSTNEELETINEELQSTNEEMQTINNELRDRTDELNQTNAFLNAILTNLRDGVVVVNPQFDILIWNDVAFDLWGLRRDELQGQSILSLDIGLPVEQLREPIRKCLNNNQSQELTVEALNRRGRKFQCRLSFNSIKDQATEPLGVIILMEDCG